jgi:hypothetical protein
MAYSHVIPLCTPRASGTINSSRLSFWNKLYVIDCRYSTTVNCVPQDESSSHPRRRGVGIAAALLCTTPSKYGLFIIIGRSVQQRHVIPQQAGIFVILNLGSLPRSPPPPFMPGNCRGIPGHRDCRPECFWPDATSRPRQNDPSQNSNYCYSGAAGDWVFPVPMDLVLEDPCYAAHRITISTAASNFATTNRENERDLKQKRQAPKSSTGPPFLATKG